MHSQSEALRKKENAIRCMSSLACFLSRNRSPLSGHSDVCSPGLLLLIVTIFLMHHFKCTSNETKYEEEPLRFLKRSLLHVSTKGYSNAGPRLDSFLYLSLGVRTIMTSSWISPSTKSAPTVSIFVGKLRNLQTRPETPAHSTTHLKKKKKSLPAISLRDCPTGTSAVSSGLNLTQSLPPLHHACNAYHISPLPTPNQCPLSLDPQVQCIGQKAQRWKSAAIELEQEVIRLRSAVVGMMG